MSFGQYGFTEVWESQKSSQKHFFSQKMAKIDFMALSR